MEADLRALILSWFYINLQDIFNIHRVCSYVNVLILIKGHGNNQNKKSTL